MSRGETFRRRWRPRGYVPLWVAVALAAVVVVVLGVWTARSMSDQEEDGRETIVFWGAQKLGDDVYALIHRFEYLPENLDPRTGRPRYRVVVGNATAPDASGDAQRLLCAVAGGVPPDVVWFDRFAIGEWAGRGALADLSPYIKAQSPDDPNRFRLEDYYGWAIEEASYKAPGDKGKAGIYGIPLDVDMRLLYVNSNLLRQEGLVDVKTGEPRPPQTWEELRRYNKLLTRYNHADDPASGIARLGFAAPTNADSGLYMTAWEAGGEMMNPERSRVTMDAPGVVRGLRFLTGLYDDVGGYAQVAGFQQSFQAGALDPFLLGSIAMKVDTTYAMIFIADWKPKMDFMVVPAPMPADRQAAGAKPVTWGGGYSLVMPATARNKEGGWRLIRYLTSKAVQMQLEQGKREQKEAEGRIYLPGLLANRAAFEELVKRYVDENPKMPPRFRQAFGVIREMMPRTLHRPVTPVGQLLWNQQFKAYENSVRHVFRDRARQEVAGHPGGEDEGTVEARLTLADAQRPVQAMLDETLTPPPPATRVGWGPWFAVYGGLVLLPLAAMVVAFRRRGPGSRYTGREFGAAMLFASPWMVGFTVFIGGPIFFSVLFAFTRYNVLSPAHWVGLENFRLLLADKTFYKALGNTAYMLIRVPLTMAVSLAIAMLLNRGLRGMSFYRTACYMPAIVPVVASSLLWTMIFNPGQGILNQALLWTFHTAPVEWMQHLFGWRFQPPLWLYDEHWSKPSLILMSLWAAGGGIIIWLAGLQSVPQQLYEAASIDGAGPWRRFWNVTVPMLSPYILFNLVVGVIGTMQIFDEAFVMTQGGPADSTLFYAYHLFRQAFEYFRMGYASALAWVLFLIVLTLTGLQLWLSTKWVHYDRT